MRITIDIDTRNKLILLWKIIKGTILLEKIPDEIKTSASGRGYHLIWYDQFLEQNIHDAFNSMIKYRKLIGDDKNRIKLDMMSPHRVPQIMFTDKEFINLKTKRGGNRL